MLGVRGPGVEAIRRTGFEGDQPAPGWNEPACPRPAQGPAVESADAHRVEDPRRRRHPVAGAGSSASPFAVSTVDVNTLIGPIQTRVKAATGRDLAVRGGGRIALSLHPKVVLSDVTLSNAPWGSAPQMLTAQRVELEVALLPLLSRRFELIEFALVGPVIALESNAKGEKNWEFAPAPGAPASTPGAPAAAMVFGVGNVEVTNGTLTYRDGGGSDVARVAIDRLFLRARDPAAPVVAEFRGKINEVPLAIEGTLGPLEALLQKRWPYPVTLQGEVAGRKAALATKLRAEDKLYTFDELRIAFGANALTGSLTALAGDPRPKLTFALSGPALVLNELPLPAIRGSASATAGDEGDTVVLSGCSGRLRAAATGRRGRHARDRPADAAKRRAARKFSRAACAGCRKTRRAELQHRGMGRHAGRRFHRRCQSDPAARRCRRISTARASRWARCWPPPACIAKCAEARPMSRSISRCAARRRMRGRARPPATCAWWPDRQRSSTPRLAPRRAAGEFAGCGQSVPCHRSIDRARVRGGPASARQRRGPRRPHDCHGDGQDRCVRQRHARFPQRDARPRIPAEGAQGPHGSGAEFREPRTLRRSVPLAARPGGHGRVGGGDRIDRRGDRHRRLVAPGPDVVVVGGGERSRTLPGCARRAGSECARAACERRPRDRPRERGRQGGRKTLWKVNRVDVRRFSRRPAPRGESA